MTTLVLQIEMTSGATYLVDLRDIEVTRYKWYVKNGYAFNKRLGYLHKYLMGDAPDNLVTIDHINRNRLDNRRCNLRWASHSLQNYNKNCKCVSKTGTRGVYAHGNKFHVKITKGNIKFFESKNTLEEAIETRKRVEIELYGEYSIQ